MDVGEVLALKIPWDDAVLELASRGWARAPEAVDEVLATRLAEDDGRQWHVAGEEGAVRQHVIGSYRPLLEAQPIVRAAGEALVTGLSTAAVGKGLPVVPAFNEATWGRYPSGAGHITAHRDPPAYGGVLAVFTLYGHALFRAWDDSGEAMVWDTGPGQIVIMRGAGWPEHGSQSATK